MQAKILILSSLRKAGVIGTLEKLSCLGRAGAEGLEAHSWCVLGIMKNFTYSSGLAAILEHGYYFNISSIISL